MRRKHPKQKNRSKLTFEKWLRSLSNEIIANLAGQWRRDIQRTKAIQREFKRRLKAENRTSLNASLGEPSVVRTAVVPGPPPRTTI